jgi:uncharacterized protein (TIGR03437 family)
MRAPALFGLVAISLQAQSLPPVSDVDYGPIFPRIRVAPGQVTPLRISGVRLLEGDGYRSLLAPPGSPLPKALGGASVMVSRGYFGEAVPQRLFEAAPLFSIEQWSTLCEARPYPDSCLRSIITVQMPFDLPPEPSPTFPLAPQPSLLKVKTGLNETAALRLTVDARRPHIAKSCDKPGGRRDVCDSQLVTSRDGRLLRTRTNLSSGIDLSPGDVAVVYAYGLGRTDPDVTAGFEVTGIVPVRGSLPVRLEWLASNGGVVESREVDPLYAGLTPGTVGLYQINVMIPEIPQGVEQCSSVLRANLRISIPAPATGLEEAVEICIRQN